MTSTNEELRQKIDAAIAYPLRQSEVADFRYEKLIDNLVELIESERGTVNG